MNNNTIQGINLSKFFTNPNKTIQGQLSNRQKFVNILSDSNLANRNTIEWISNTVYDTSEDELNTLCNVFSSNIKINNTNDVIVACQLIDILIDSAKMITREQFYTLFSTLRHIDDILFSLYENSDKSKTDEFENAISVMDRVGNKLASINNYFMYGEDSDRGLFKSKIELFTLPSGSLSEGIMFGTDPNVDAFSPDSTSDNEIDKMVKYLRDNMYSTDRSIDVEILIGHIDDIPNYTHEVLSSNSTDKNYLSIPYFIISQIHNNVKNNINGLTKLYDVIDDIIDKLDDIVYTSFESKEASNNLLSFLNDIQDSIAKEEYLLRRGDGPEDIDPLVECGLGFIYECTPLHPGDELSGSRAKLLCEAYQNPIILREINNFMNGNVVNEGAVREEIKKLKQEQEDRQELNNYQHDLDMQRKKAKMDAIAEKDRALDSASVDKKYAKRLSSTENKAELIRERQKTKYLRKMNKEKFKQERSEERLARKKNNRDASRELAKVYLKSGARSVGRLLRTPISPAASNINRARKINDLNDEISELRSMMDNTDNPVLKQKLATRIDKLNRVQGATAAQIASNGSAHVVAIDSDPRG